MNWTYMAREVAQICFDVERRLFFAEARGRFPDLVLTPMGVARAKAIAGVPVEDMVSLVQTGCMLQADAAASALHSSFVGGGATHCDDIANALQLRFCRRPQTCSCHPAGLVALPFRADLPYCRFAADGPCNRLLPAACAHI